MSVCSGGLSDIRHGVTRRRFPHSGRKTAGLGRVGHVQDAVLADHGRLDVSSVYACKPALNDTAWAAFSPRGLPSEHFHADAFEPARDTSA
jgi:NAD(P)H-flavin reductase